MYLLTDVWQVKDILKNNKKKEICGIYQQLLITSAYWHKKTDLLTHTT
jgi:hypothetical protein